MLLFFLLHAKILIKGGIHMENAPQKTNHYYAVIFTANYRMIQQIIVPFLKKSEELAKTDLDF